PATDQFDFVVGQGISRLEGRHPRLVLGCEQIDNQALLRLAGSDGIVLGSALTKALVSAHLELALALLGIMTGEAILLQNRSHILDEADRTLWLSAGGGR